MLGPGLVLAAAAVVLWVRLLPLSLALVPEEQRDLLRYRGADGREHVYLGDFDSYLWVREARNVLRTGTTCDAVVAGECRDTYADAPVGAPMHYHRSFHVTAIVALHRVLDRLLPGIPLTVTAYWVPVVVGLLGVPPAVGIGWRLAGPLAGLIAAIAIGVNALFLQRSIGGDNDVWNVVLPLWAVWAAVEALEARRADRRLALAALAGGVVALHAATWSGWVLTGAVLAAGFGAAVLLSVSRALAGRQRVRAAAPRGRRAGDRRPRRARAPRRTRRRGVVPGGAGAELRRPPVRHAPGAAVRDPPRSRGRTLLWMGSSRDHAWPRRRLAHANRRGALRGVRGGRDPDRRARCRGGACLPAGRARRVVGHAHEDPRDDAARCHRDRMVGLRTLDQVRRRASGDERRQHALATGGALDRANAPRADRARGDRSPPHARLRLRRGARRRDGPPRCARPRRARGVRAGDRAGEPRARRGAGPAPRSRPRARRCRRRAGGDALRAAARLPRPHERDDPGALLAVP